MRVSKLFSSIYYQSRTIRSTVVSRSCSDAPKVEKCESPPDDGEESLVLGVYQDDKKLELTEAGKEIDQKSGGKVSQQLNILSPHMKLGKAFVLTDVPGYSAVALASIGPKDAGYNKLEELEEGRENIRWGVGAGVCSLQERGAADIRVDSTIAPDAAAEAAELAAWKFDEFRFCNEANPPRKVSPLEEDNECWKEGQVRGRAQNWARWLCDMPANKMTPIDFAQATLDVLCPLGVSVTAYERDWISKQRMEAFLSVARGSCEAPVFLTCDYSPPGAKNSPILIAAKGVTFDCGGMCLKPPEQMRENRGSMAGAAVAVAAIRALAELKVPLRVAAVIPLCENMVSGQCLKVGDVVRALNGMSIQVEHTDMEGRLMLADALVYGQSVFKPSLVIDIATFTRGVLLATGGGAYGCFSNSEAMWDAARHAGAISAERPWRFPLWDYYHKQITNYHAVDLRNKGAGHATPCLGAAFLKNFVCGDWLHMDITGVGKLAHSPAPPYLHRDRMTGRPARALTVMLQGFAHGPATESGHGPAKESGHGPATESGNGPATGTGQKTAAGSAP